MKKLLLIGIFFTGIVNATNIGDKVFYCNYDLGKVMESTVIDKDMVPVIDPKNESLILDDRHVISEYDVIKGDYIIIKLSNCI